MTQSLGYFLERATMLQQATCHGMAQRMCSTVFDANARVGITNHFTHSIRTDRNIMRGDKTNKDLGVRSWWAFKTQVIHDRLACGFRHWQDIFTVGLVMSDRNCSVNP